MVLHSRIISKVERILPYPFESRIICFSTSAIDKSSDFGSKHDVDAVITKVLSADSEREVLQYLVRDYGCHSIQITHTFMSRLLQRFQDDWTSALGVFRWAKSCSGYKPSPESYEKLVDILGKMRQMEKMMALVVEMHEDGVLTIGTIAKVMRRFAGAGDWKDAVKMFDELDKFGLEKNTDSMNMLLDTLCKEKKVEQAREIFLDLKSLISPNANTYNIFIHGWCKIARVEEAHWTIQEMKGNGFFPCVISYSTILQFYCSRGNFSKVHELLDEMEAQGCPPNVITFTTVLHSLTKSGDINDALQTAERAASVHCKLDTQFYNAYIHTLGRAGHVEKALYVFTKEMPRNGINPNTSTYNTMIAMFCHHRHLDRALQYLKKLENSPYCKPDTQSFYPLLKLYLQKGKVDTCLIGLLDDMVKKHYLCLDLAAYTLLIHGLCRGKKCEWAYRLFWEMIGQNIKPRYLTCSILLKEIKLKNMNDEAEMIEDFMKKMKSS